MVGPDTSIVSKWCSSAGKPYNEKMVVSKSYIRVLLASFAIALLIVGCSSPPSTEYVIDVPLDEPVKMVVLLDSGGQYASRIRSSLRKSGFRIKAFASQSIRNKPIHPGQTIATGSDTFSKAESRYGIRLSPGGIVDICMVSDAVNYGSYTMELIDISWNESIVIVSAGGWTSDCAWHSGDLFRDLAQQLREAVDTLQVGQ